MNFKKCFVLGGDGLVGSSIVHSLKAQNYEVESIDFHNYNQFINKKCDIFINANGNTYRYKANLDPLWDYSASVESVIRSLKDFNFSDYIYISTIDVYDNLFDLRYNNENTQINSLQLDYYGFHKWLSERIISKYCPRFIILRLGTVLGNNLIKGPIYDLYYNKTIFMSEKSQLTFIDTNTLCNVLMLLIENEINNDIFNITGTGYVNVGELISLFFPESLPDKDHEHVLHRYNINTKKINQLINIDTSFNIVSRFIKGII